MAIYGNEKYFDRAKFPNRTSLGATTAFDDSILRARGFNEVGNRIGGISNPKLVILPPGTLLIRTYGGAAKEIGQWWFTVEELNKIISYAGHADLAEGRNSGKGLLHAFFAILLQEWNSTCSQFILVSVNKSLYSFYGEGDHVLYDATGGQKAALIMSNGRQRGVC